MDKWQTYPVEFRGGLVTNLSPLQQGINAPGSARILRNFEPSVEGGYRRIEGYDKYDPAILYHLMVSLSYTEMDKAVLA